ncbi:receptor-type tyrosine-protein phosphatase H-like [Penaeus chinensis]|uniref:receptor-type tyrosine-protein phosphatase H-like n=1 Tax=Penaeus chinensis TaxID=139456 RepID=UPI001FB6A841|nr:receptor-type tyrosine-protein phosphatase H-like [Penaeus chinensis]
MVALKNAILVAALLTFTVVVSQKADPEEYANAEASCPPANLTAEPVPGDPDSLDVTWEEPDPPECDVIAYTVSWQPASSQGPLQQIDTNATSFTITGLEDFRKYNVCVETQRKTSKSGPGDRECVVGITNKPECPAHMNATSVTVSEVPNEPRELDVTWVIPDTAAYCPVKNISLTYRMSESTNTENVLLHPNDTNFTIDDLKPCTSYQVCVIAVINETGLDDEAWNEGVTGVEIPGPPVSVSVDLVNDVSDSLNVTWKEPDPMECDVIVYTVSWLPVSGQDSLLQNTSLTEFTITGLDPFRSYNVCVAALTEAGAGNFMCDVGRTDEAVPGAPTNLSADATTPESILVSWAPPELPNGVITGYNISWACSGNHGSAIGNATFTVYNITGLSPCSSCDVAVSAATAKGFGSAGPGLKATSGEAPPPQPSKISCSSVPPSADSIVVTWFPPATLCIVSMYNVTYIGDVLWSDQKEVNSLETSNQFASLNSLTPWTRYNVCVAGIVLDDFVGGQSCCDAVTKDAASGPPASLNVSGTSSSSISVFWKEPLTPNGRIDGYKLKFGGDAVQVQNVTEYTITGLAKNSNYNISLQAHNEAGYGAAATTTATTQKAANVPGIVAGVVCGLLLAAAGVAAFLYRDALRNLVAKKTSKREEVQEHPLSSTTTAVKKNSLWSYIDALQEDTQRALEEEFASLKQQSPRHQTYDAEMDINKPKNRFSNVLAFDHSRVRISRKEGAAPSDYINANYIKDHAGQPSFVAAQGPKDETLDDFWRMVWEQKVHTIVMLTNLMEKGKVMCAKYWPAAGARPLECDIYQIRNLNEVKDSLYVSRILEVTAGQQKRIVKHYHFLAWPDFGTPEREEDLLGFIAAVRRSSAPAAHPVVVHCRAGVGRTGTFIGLWNLMDAVNACPNSSNIDVYQTVLNMRKNRPIMVQTTDQYLYLYKCIATYIDSPEKWSHQGSDHAYENKGFEGRM